MRCWRRRCNHTFRTLTMASCLNLLSYNHKIRSIRFVFSLSFSLIIYLFLGYLELIWNLKIEGPPPPTLPTNRKKKKKNTNLKSLIGTRSLFMRSKLATYNSFYHFLDAPFGASKIYVGNGYILYMLKHDTACALEYLCTITF